MAGHDTAHEALTESASPAPAQAPAAPQGSPIVGLAAAVGNRSMARAVAAGTAPRAMIAPDGRMVVARAPTVTPAPSAVIARDDRKLTDNDKARLRTMVVARLRGAVGQLADPKKADMPRIARHLKPVEATLNGFAAGGEAGGTISSAAEEVRSVALAVESAGGGMKPAIFRAVSRWQAAQRQMGAARSAIQGELIKAERAKKKAASDPDPEGPDREQWLQDISHIKALQTQTGNAVKDLVEAPRNEEGLLAVLETNVAVLDELDALGSLDIEPANALLDAARQAFTDGVATLTPFALKRDDFLREMRQTLQNAANTIATLVGDATEEVEPDPDADPTPAPPPVPPDPAPSPNPLPPPPPPPTK